MQFTWVDYPNLYESEIENWCDETIHYALDSESVKEEHHWYLNISEHILNKDYFCKVILDGEIIVALIMLVMRGYTQSIPTETVVYIDTLIINPTLRHQGYGTRIINEIIQYNESITPFNNNLIVAQVHKDNYNSNELFKKLGFHFIYTDAEVNDDWFDWVYPMSAANSYLTWRDG